MKKTLAVSLFLFMINAGFIFAANETNEESSTTANHQVQMFRVSGNVRDFNAGEALAGASVSVNGKKVFTDFDGNFSADKVSGNTCEITVSLISYESQVFVLPVAEAKDIKVNLKQ